MSEMREPGPRSREIVERERRHAAAGMQGFALYAGLAMARGQGCTLVDEDGQEYIDFIAGITIGSVGHCHPHYVEALKKQVEKLTFGSFTTEARARFLELVASVTPAGLSRIQMFSGGAETVEAALRLAKVATGKDEVIGFWGGFHGKTGGVLGLLGSDFKHHLGPFMPGQYLTPYADCSRCPLRLTYPDCGIACADYVRDVIRVQTGGEIAAIIVEPMQGTAGNVIPPEGFLRAVQQIAKEAGALLICDEMITGFGRTGLMWGSEHDGVVPDVMTVGKGVGGGFPLSAVISTDDLTSRKPWSNPSASSSSYGGNPLAAAAGVAALEIILKEELVKNSERVGAVMLTRLEALKEKYRCVGEVRGRGLMLGMELVKDRRTKEPLGKDVTQALYKECLRRGLAAMTYSPTVRINPPLVIRGRPYRGRRRRPPGPAGRMRRAAPWRALVRLARGAPRARGAGLRRHLHASFEPRLPRRECARPGTARAVREAAREYARGSLPRHGRRRGGIESASYGAQLAPRSDAGADGHAHSPGRDRPGAAHRLGDPEGETGCDWRRQRRQLAGGPRGGGRRRSHGPRLARLLRPAGLGGLAAPDGQRAARDAAPHGLRRRGYGVPAARFRRRERRHSPDVGRGGAAQPRRGARDGRAHRAARRHACAHGRPR